MFEVLRAIRAGRPVQYSSRKIKRSLTPIRRQAFSAVLFATLLIAGGATKQALAQTRTATVTTLTVASGGGATTSVSAGSVVTLTATVTGGAAVTPGQVQFCDSSANLCTDIHLLRTAQLTSTGTATIKLLPGPGTHTYRAIFLGTKTYAASSSATAQLTVSGTTTPTSTATTISKTGSWGNYNLTANVTEIGSASNLAGTVSFLDTSTGNSQLTTAQLAMNATKGITFTTQPSYSFPGSANPLVADFNNDGFPDVVWMGLAQIGVFLGHGDGTFTALPTLSGTSNIYGFAICDFNSDGNQDLAVISNSNGGSGGSGQYLEKIWLGNGDGTFSSGNSFSIGSTTALIEGYNIPGDFNGDGIADLIVPQTTNAVQPTYSLLVLLGKGDGSFTQSTVSLSEPILYTPAVGDFNGDGKLDLVYSKSDTNSVIILPGNGDGTFGSAVTVNVPNQAARLVSCDFNGDGKLDLMVANLKSSLASLLTSNGDGTFIITPIGTLQGSNGSTLTTGDFNADGVVDVYAQYGSQTAFLLGHGDGTFAQAALTQLGTDILSIPLGSDLNGDGRSDFANFQIGNPSWTWWAQLLEPIQTASATAIMVSPMGVGQHLIEASYVGNSNFGSSTSSTTMIYGQPPATTTTLTIAAAGSAVNNVNASTAVTLAATVLAGGTPLTSGQVNFCDATANTCNDAHLIGSAQVSANGTAVFKFVPGPGQHSYKAVLQTHSGGFTSSSAVATLTVTAPPSVVYPTTTAISQSGTVGNYTLSSTVMETGESAPITGNISFLDTSYSNSPLATAPLISTSGLVWNLSTSFPTTNNMTAHTVASDFNGDGIVDIAYTLTPASGTSTANTINILLGNGDGTFHAGTTITLTAIMNSMVVGDFNGDGKLDLAASAFNPVSQQPSSTQIYLGKGDGTFNLQAGMPMISNGGAVFAAVDINGDGRLDLVVNEQQNVRILLGNGDGTFAQGPMTGLTLPSGLPLLLVADLNGDGVPDLVATSSASGISLAIALGNGDGTFRAGSPLQTTGITSPTAAAAGDFNGDGLQDFVVFNSSTANVFLNNGTGGFGAATSSTLATYGDVTGNIVAADFNHDGNLDVAIANTNSSQGNQLSPDLTVALGSGDGRFTRTYVDTQIARSAYLIANDVNGDGILDLVVSTASGGNVLVTVPTQTATATATGVSPNGPAPHLVAANYPGDSNYSTSISTTTSLSVKLATPQFSPAPGTYTGLASITISDATPGAYIGTNFVNAVFTGLGPTSGPANLTIPIYSSGTFTLQASATENGYQTSDYVSATYTVILSQAPAPIFSLAPGYYPGTQTLTITDAQPGVTILYSTDGRTAGVGSTVYSGPITISSSETVSAIAGGGGYSLSQPISAQYYIGSSPAAAYIYTIAGNGIPGFTGDGNPAVQANLSSPYTSAMDSAGNLYFTEVGNNRVRKIAAGTGIMTTVAGNGIAGYSGDNGPSTSAELNNPRGVAVDSAGNIYILDSLNQVVRKVMASTGIITTFAGSSTATTLGDGGPASSAQLGQPLGLAVDGAGNLYIGTSSGRVRRVDASSGTITTFAGNGSFVPPPNLTTISIGAPPTAPLRIGDGGPAISATLDEPYGIAVDAAGNVYIGDDSLNVVRKVTAGTGVITTVAGTTMGINSFGPYVAEGVAATSTRLNGPIALAVDAAGDLFIADVGNNAIREVTAGTGIINTVVGMPITNPIPGLTFPCPTTSGGDGGIATQTALCAPQGITLDSAGNLYIAQPSQHRIRKVLFASPAPTTATAAPAFSVAAGSYDSPQTVTITDATPGAQIYVTMTGASATTSQVAQYHNPILVDGSVNIGAIAVAPGSGLSSTAMAAYTITSQPAALITTVAGTGTAGIVGSGGLALNQQLSTTANGVAADRSGNVYLADAGAQVVWKITPLTGAISAVAGMAGTASPSSPISGIPSTSAFLRAPSHVSLDAAGNLYIADSGDNVVSKVDAQTGNISIVAGGGTFTFSTSDGGAATSAYLSNPQGIALDSSGNLYIADQSHNTIRKVTPAGIISTIAGTPSVSNSNTGSGFSGDGGPATSAKLYNPTDLKIDSKGNLYILDSGNQRVRMIAAGTGIITTVVGNGNFGQTGDGNPATSAEAAPRGIALDAADNLYISNSPNTIRMIPAGGGAITTVVGSGLTGFSGDGGSARVAELSSPTGLAFDATGNLYFTDTNNYRVREVLMKPRPGITWNAPATITYGTALSSMQLNASSNVAGSFSYSPAAGTILPAGTSTLQVTFTPTDIAHYTTATKTVTISISQAATSTALALSNQNLTLTATVISATSGIPTGKVGFYQGSTLVGTGTLSNGVASYTTTSAPTSNVQVSAQYNGDTNFQQSSSTPILLVAVAPASTTLTIPSGGSVTDLFRVTVPSGYSGTVQFSCTGLPTGVTCSFQPSSITFAGTSTTANTTLTIQTTARASMEMPSSPWTNSRNSSNSTLAGLVGIPGLLALALSIRRRRWPLRLLVILLLLGSLSAGITACGGTSPSSGSSPTSGTTLGTPAGTSNVQVIASGPGGLTQNTILTVTVQ